MIQTSIAGDNWIHIRGEQDMFPTVCVVGQAKKQLPPALLAERVAENRPLKLNR